MGAVVDLTALMTNNVWCRHRVTIIIAYTASTLLVMLWLTYIIHVTLEENEEDAQGICQGPRVSEFLKACAASSGTTCCAMPGDSTTQP